MSIAEQEELLEDTAMTFWVMARSSRSWRATTSPTSW